MVHQRDALKGDTLLQQTQSQNLLPTNNYTQKTKTDID